MAFLVAERARVRIAIIGPLELPGSGGVKQHCEEIGARLAARGHEVTVLVARGRRRRTHRGMEVRRVGSLPVRHLDRLAYSLMASLHTRFRRYDVVHYHSFASTTFLRLARRPGRALAVTVHRLEWQDEKWGRVARALLRRSERVAVRNADLLVAVSRSLADNLSSRYPAIGEVHCIPNGVDLVSLDPAQATAVLTDRGLESERFVLVVGRLVPEKGTDTVLEAWERLVGEGRTAGWRLAIVGGARHRTRFVRELEARAERLSPTVAVTGILVRAELAALDGHAGIVASASHHEGQPLTVIEAIVSHRCLVLSDIPAHRELCGDAAVYFPTADADALATTLGALIASPERRQELAARSASIAQTHDFGWDASAERLETLLLGVTINRQR